MKRLGTVLFALAVVGFGVFSCQKTLDQSMDRNEVSANVSLPAECVGPYNITLVSRTLQADGWHWVWRIVNPNPGNGEDGTVQALSHFNVLVPVCEPAINVTYAGYSMDGITYTANSTDQILDNSYNSGVCERNDLANTPAIKFDVGGEYYFKLVVPENYQPGVMYGMYKSGQTTGCGMTCFEGISCLIDNPPPPEGCSFSQGFWFAKPISEENAWPGGSLMMGPWSYTQAEGKALFFVSGNIELKRAFTQAATIKLSIASGYLTDPSGIMQAVNNIENVLNGLPKLTPANIASVNRGLSAATRRNLSNWAGTIGNYVDANHCELNPGY